MQYPILSPPKPQTCLFHLNLDVTALFNLLRTQPHCSATLASLSQARTHCQYSCRDPKRSSKTPFATSAAALAVRGDQLGCGMCPVSVAITVISDILKWDVSSISSMALPFAHAFTFISGILKWEESSFHASPTHTHTHTHTLPNSPTHPLNQLHAAKLQPPIAGKRDHEVVFGAGM